MKSVSTASPSNSGSWPDQSKTCCNDTWDQFLRTDLPTSLGVRQETLNTCSLLCLGLPGPSSSDKILTSLTDTKTKHEAHAACWDGVTGVKCMKCRCVWQIISAVYSQGQGIKCTAWSSPCHLSCTRYCLWCKSGIVVTVFLGCLWKNWSKGFMDLQFNL